MSKTLSKKEARAVVCVAASGASDVVVLVNSVVDKSVSAAELRCEKLLKRATAKSAKLIASAKKKAALIESKSKARALLYAEKGKKKAALLACKAVECAAKHKASYRVSDWKSYNESLKSRGEITLYLSPSVLRELKNKRKKKLLENVNIQII